MPIAQHYKTSSFIEDEKNIGLSNLKPALLQITQTGFIQGHTTQLSEDKKGDVSEHLVMYDDGVYTVHYFLWIDDSLSSLEILFVSAQKSHKIFDTDMIRVFVTLMSIASKL